MSKKLEGYFHNIPVYSDPECPPDQIFLMPENPEFTTDRDTYEIVKKSVKWNKVTDKLLTKLVKAYKGKFAIIKLAQKPNSRRKND